MLMLMVLNVLKCQELAKKLHELIVLYEAMVISYLYVKRNCCSCDYYTVTLESHLYTVGESESFVDVCVLLTPAASQIIIVSINTTEASATGNQDLVQSVM